MSKLAVDAIILHHFPHLLLYRICATPDYRAPPHRLIFGHLIDGTQAEYVRVPFAENSLHKMPER